MNVLISIIIPTYNRAHTLPRAINSVLKQDYPTWELIIIDDGSQDNTRQLLNNYKNPRIHIYYHEANKGALAAKNTGINHARGDWFTILDSDDEMNEQALSTLIQVPERIDPKIDAVSCNCIDSQTGKFSGYFLKSGMEHDQYLDAETIMRYCRGEFWGITRLNLLHGERFDERTSAENSLWCKLNLHAHRFYIHRGLRIYHTEGNDRVTQFYRKLESKVTYDRFISLEEDIEYLRQLKEWAQDSYRGYIFNKGITCIYQRDRARALECFRELDRYPGGKLRSLILFGGLIIGPSFIRMFLSLRSE